MGSLSSPVELPVSPSFRVVVSGTSAVVDEPFGISGLLGVSLDGLGVAEGFGVAGASVLLGFVGAGVGACVGAGVGAGVVVVVVVVVLVVVGASAVFFVYG